MTVGVPTGGKPVNLHQLGGELGAAGLSVSAGLSLVDACVATYDAQGQLADFPSADVATVQQVLAEHVGMRDKTDAELATEFQASSDPARKQDIRDMQAGLLPREQVPMA